MQSLRAQLQPSNTAPAQLQPGNSAPPATSDKPTAEEPAMASSPNSPVADSDSSSAASFSPMDNDRQRDLNTPDVISIDSE